jgi:hypothetical protein
MGYTLYYVKSTLRVSPYFHVLTLFKLFQKSYFQDPAIFKSFPIKVHHILLIQGLQVIELKHHNNYMNQVEFIEFLRDDCHKQAILISESLGDLN